jgi:hypothetical protein
LRFKYFEGTYEIFKPVKAPTQQIHSAKMEVIKGDMVVKLRKARCKK